MPHQVRNDPTHRKEIARRRLDRAQRQPGRIHVSAPAAQVGIETGSAVRRQYLTAAAGGYRIAHPNTPVNRGGTVKVGAKTYEADDLKLFVGGREIKPLRGLGSRRAP